MMAGCKKTCKLCGTTCEDATGLEAFCGTIKANNQCEVMRKEAYALCSKTCGFCTEEDKVPTVPTAVPTDAPTNPPTGLF